MTETETPPSVPLPAPSGYEPVQRAPKDRVPADQRVGGLDRRTIWPGEIAEAYAVDTPEVDHARAEIARVRGTAVVSA